MNNTPPTQRRRRRRVPNKHPEPPPRRWTTPETGSTDFWRPADNIGNVHLIVSTGKTRTITSQYGDSEGIVCEHIIVWGDNGTLVKHDDVVVLSVVLKSGIAVPGIYCAVLEQPDRAYVWVTPNTEWENYLDDWIESHIVFGNSKPHGVESIKLDSYDDPPPVIEPF